MKTLYSSSFVSIVLAFLMIMGANNQQVEVVQSLEPVHFTNVVELESLLNYEAIQIDAFEDLECKNCQKFVSDTLVKLEELQHEIQDLSVNLYFVPNINDEFQNKLALILKCVPGNLSNKLHSKFHEHKAELQEKLDGILEELEIDHENLNICVESNQFQEVIEEEIRYASEKGISKKPSLIINGTKLIGYQPFENIERVIRAEVKKRETVSPFDLLQP